MIGWRRVVLRMVDKFLDSSNWAGGCPSSCYWEPAGGPQWVNLGGFDGYSEPMV